MQQGKLLDLYWRRRDALYHLTIHDKIVTQKEAAAAAAVICTQVFQRICIPWWKHLLRRRRREPVTRSILLHNGWRGKNRKQLGEERKIGNSGLDRRLLIGAPSIYILGGRPAIVPFLYCFISTITHVSCRTLQKQFQSRSFWVFTNETPSWLSLQDTCTYRHIWLQRWLPCFRHNILHLLLQLPRRQYLLFWRYLPSSGKLPCPTNLVLWKQPPDDMHIA